MILLSVHSQRGQGGGGNEKRDAKMWLGHYYIGMAGLDWADLMNNLGEKKKANI